MVTVSATPSPVAIEAQVDLSPYVIHSESLSAPGGLYPVHSNVYEMDEYRLHRGWPVEVPPYDIRSSTLVSCDGQVLSSRDAPHELITGADLRWVAESDYYDQDLQYWRPVQGSAEYVWRTAQDFAPDLVPNYEYRIGAERFTQTALNFDSDAYRHMWIDLTGELSGLMSYTVIMVLSPNSIYGNRTDGAYGGIWYPGNPTPSSDTFSEVPYNYVAISLLGHTLYVETESTPKTASVSAANSVTTNAPTYLAFTLGRPVTTVYAASGPNNIQFKPVTLTATPVGLNPHIVLGRSNGDILHTADMALFDIGIYPLALSDTQVKDQFTLLSQVYGGDR